MMTGTLESYDLKLVLMELYETQFQIYNHDDPALQTPLALVTLHPSENPSEYGLLYRYIEQYKTLGIKEEFGLSLMEFFRLPMDVADRLIFMSRDIIARRLPELNNATRELERGKKS